MTAAGQIVSPMGAGRAALPRRRPRAAAQRRGIAAVLSALLHVAVVVVALFDLGLFDLFAPVMEMAIPVEVVLVPPDILRAPDREEPEAVVPEPEQVAEPEPVPEEVLPKPPTPAAVGEGGERVAPELEDEDIPVETPAAETAAAPVEPVPAVEPETGVEVLPRAQLKPEVRPAAPPPRQQAAARSGYIGDWILDPLHVEYGHRCGSARVRGRLRLVRDRGEGRFEGELRTTIIWALCPAEGARYQVMLSIRGGRVTMTGSGGFVDRGVVRNGVMRMTDAYGVSIWRRR